MCGRRIINPSGLNTNPTTLQPGHAASLVIDLSALKYRDAIQGAAYSHEVSPTFDKWLRTTPKSTATIQVLIIPDAAYFKPQDRDERVRTLTINIARLRNAQQRGFRMSSSPFQYLSRHGGKASFSFADVKAVFKLTPKTGVVGNASVGLSFWIDGTPIDELSYTACIVNTTEDTCPADTSVHNDSFAGVDISHQNTRPDIAIHILELNADNLIGVLHCSSCAPSDDEYLHWQFGRSSEWFRNQFATTILPSIRKAAVGDDAAQASPGTADALDVEYNPALLDNVGDALYSLLFHSDSGQMPDAEQTFRTFVQTSIDREQPKQCSPLHIRAGISAVCRQLLHSPFAVGSSKDA